MTQTSSRDESLDIARGMIMALMALDHTRMFFSSAPFDPVAVDQTTAGYFITRWVTHLCAPGFFFLVGVGSALAERGGMSPMRSTFWLASRGLWLIALELTLIGFAWSFNAGWSWLGVIWSLGASMMALALLRRAPKIILGAAAAAFILLHNALPVGQIVTNDGLRALLYEAGSIATPVGEKAALFPVIPWLAMTLLGYALGGWLTPGGKSSAPRFALLGLAGIALFAVSRTIGVGQPAEGGAIAYADPAKAAMSFFNVEKYPPSLQFAAVTLGLFCLFVAGVRLWSMRRGGPASLLSPLIAFGRVPFAFYVLHLYVIHLLALAAAAILGWPTDFLFWSGTWPRLQPPDGYGFGLAGVYGAWLVVLLILYPFCAWFSGVKSRRRDWWLRYL